jgi:hypothetical protein
MQDELDAEGLAVPVRILGVNQIGHEEGDAEMCEGRDLPWLDETESFDAWWAWNAVYMDVILLNEDNSKLGVFNTAPLDLEEPANYQLLHDWLVAAAQ